MEGVLLLSKPKLSNREKSGAGSWVLSLVLGLGVITLTVLKGKGEWRLGCSPMGLCFLEGKRNLSCSNGEYGGWGGSVTAAWSLLPPERTWVSWRGCRFLSEGKCDTGVVIKEGGADWPLDQGFLTSSNGFLTGAVGGGLALLGDSWSEVEEVLAEGFGVSVAKGVGRVLTADIAAGDEGELGAVSNLRSGFDKDLTNSDWGFTASLHWSRVLLLVASVLCSCQVITVTMNTWEWMILLTGLL